MKTSIWTFSLRISHPTRGTIAVAKFRKRIEKMLGPPTMRQVIRFLQMERMLRHHKHTVFSTRTISRWSRYSRNLVRLPFLLGSLNIITG